MSTIDGNMVDGIGRRLLQTEFVSKEKTYFVSYRRSEMSDLSPETETEESLLECSIDDELYTISVSECSSREAVAKLSHLKVTEPVADGFIIQPNI